MDEEASSAEQQSFSIESSQDGRPLTDDDLRRLFENGRLDGLLLLQQTMRQTRMAMSVADMTKDDAPLVYVNEAFCKLTGYEREEIIGRNCRFLQGPKTDKTVASSIRACMENQSTEVFEILNYRKDGSAFWNALHMGPVFDAKGKLQYYFGSQWDVTSVHAARQADIQASLIQSELNHRTQNIFAVVSSLISLSGIGAKTPQEAVQGARERVAALGAAHRTSLQLANDGQAVRLAALVNDLIKPYADNADGNMRIEGEDVVLASDTVSAICMAIHELATNSMKYGYLGGKALDASFKWEVITQLSGEQAIHMVWSEIFQDGKGPKGGGEDGTGSRIMRALLQPHGGSMERRFADGLLEVRLTVPMA